MNHLQKFLLLTVFLLPALLVNAQDKKTEMADVMRSNGMIYVVVAVMLTILAGLILYLVRIERKVRKLEKEN
jgi:hypothetical protein